MIKWQDFIKLQAIKSAHEVHKQKLKIAHVLPEKQISESLRAAPAQ